MTAVRTREATEEDIEEVREIYRATYGDTYPYQDFYDRDWLKRTVYGDHMVMVVAESEDDGAILGTASVDLDTGSHSDLTGELGRLAVRPDARGQGVGAALMAHRIQVVRERLHLAIVECRTIHPYAQKISRRFGCAPVGFLPLKHRFRERESVAVFAQPFGPALELRRNHPRVVPMAAPLAHLALANLGTKPDVIADESAPPYPLDKDFELTELATERFPDLLRIERGRVRRREVFGPVQLHYGFFKLRARRANYLVARRPGRGDRAVAGGLGFVHDATERNIRIFELIAATDEAIVHLFQRLLDQARALEVEYMEVDVNAHATRLQRTLLELGFLPAAYIPALAFHHVERLDSVKMVRLLIPPTMGRIELIDDVQPIFDTVMRDFQTRTVLPRLESEMGKLSIFGGLNDEQARRLASTMSVQEFGPGEELFTYGQAAANLFALLEGEVDVRVPSGTTVGTVSAGATVGENAMLAETVHSASVSARSTVVAAVLTRAALTDLTAQRPDIAVILYRNLAVGLGRKLRSAGTAFDRTRLG